MFRYAFARALQVNFYPDYKLILNARIYRKQTPSNIRMGNENSLKYFRVKIDGYNEESFRDILLRSKNFLRIFMWVLHHYMIKISSKVAFRCINTKCGIDAKLIQPLFNKVGIYDPLSCSEYIKPQKSSSHSILCMSCFENAQYFDNIREILLEDFTPKHDPLPRNIELLKDIQTSESVCVHIRRGDFLSSKNAPSFYVCDEDYFSTAMKAIHEEIPNCKFFVFSDDVENVKKNMHFPFEVTYSSGKSPVWEDMRLMYSCKHFIISNSTFSWWAQYLSRNPHKIVYAPTPWHWKGEKWEGLYLPYMRTIKCHKH